MASPIVDFLDGKGPHGGGLLIDELWAQDDEYLEHRHDFIQWLFPLQEPSRAVVGAPVLTAQDVASMRASEAAQRGLDLSSRRMMRFFQATDAWLSRHDHNHLRITRIIRSLRLLTGDQAADAFRDGLIADLSLRRGRVNPTSLEFWREA